MAHCQFEPELKFDCVREIITIIRSGEIGRPEALKVAEHAACFIGCGAAMLGGKDDDDDDLIGASVSPELQQVADELEAAIPTLTGEGAALALPWLEIAKILIPLLLQLLVKDNA